MTIHVRLTQTIHMIFRQLLGNAENKRQIRLLLEGTNADRRYWVEVVYIFCFSWQSRYNIIGSERSATEEKMIFYWLVMAMISILVIFNKQISGWSGFGFLIFPAIVLLVVAGNRVGVFLGDFEYVIRPYSWTYGVMAVWYMYCFRKLEGGFLSVLLVIMVLASTYQFFKQGGYSLIWPLWIISSTGHQLSERHFRSGTCEELLHVLFFVKTKIAILYLIEYKYWIL